MVNASGCGTTVKDYGFMFRSEPEPWRSRADRSSALACDISEFLARSGYAPTREAPGLTVAYHSACSLQHGQKVTAEPKSLLQRAGFTVVEPAEPHICCGSAGTYNMLQPEIATRLRDRKLGNLRATGADVIAAGNIGCITQLGGGGVPWSTRSNCSTGWPVVRPPSRPSSEACLMPGSPFCLSLCCAQHCRLSHRMRAHQATIATRHSTSCSAR